MNNTISYISTHAKYFLIALLFPLSPFLNSCKDNPGNLSPTVLPKSDLINAYVVDTTTVTTSMYLKDSVVTIGATPSLLGSYNDPVFGETKASLYIQVYPSNLPKAPWEATNSTVDSAVLLLQIYQASYYGGSDPQTFEVYQTRKNIYTDTTYYSNTTFPDTLLMGSQQVALPNPSLTDTLRIKLSKTWWKNFSNQIETGTYWTSSFNQLIKSIYVTTATPLQLPGQGSLVNVNLFSSFSGIYFYYHHNSSPGIDSSMYFPIGSNYMYFTHFDHDYSTTYLGSIHPSGKRDSVSAGQLMYVQGMGGVIGRLNFPNLYKNWQKVGPVIINEAEVTFPVQPQTQTVGPEASYGPPPSINLLATDTNWVQSGSPLMPDIGTSYFDGSFNSGNNTYTCVITQYIQGVINGKITDRGLYVCPNNQPIYANGVVIYGAQHGVTNAQRTKLTIYYTPVKKP